MIKEKNEPVAADRELVVSRVVNASRELVFEVWTKPEHLANWWGPNGHTITNKEMELRPGGKWQFTMHGPDGKEYPNVITYREIQFPEKITFAHAGNVDDKEVDFETIVTFEQEEERKTRVTMTAIFPSKEVLEFVIREYGAKEGGQQTIAKMAAYVEQMSR